jgi:hypothetical protein
MSIRRRAGESIRRRPKLSIKALVIGFALSTTGLTLAATPQGREIVTLTNSAITSSIDHALRQMLNTQPIPAAEITREAGFNVGLPKTILGLKLGTIVKVGDAPIAYAISYSGAGHCSITFTLTLRHNAGPQRMNLFPLPNQGMMFGGNTRSLGLLGSSQNCSNTSDFLNAFIAAQ